MQKIVFSITITMILVGACRFTSSQSSPPQATSQQVTHRQILASKFYREFSLSDTITRIPAEDLQCSRTFGTSDSSSSTKDKLDVFTKQSALNCQLKQGGSFDEADFMNKLKAEIEKEIISSGVKVGDIGIFGSAFYYGYEGDSTYGWIDVVVMKGEGSCYRFSYTLREISLD